jgi:hypothetical protein
MNRAIFTASYTSLCSFSSMIGSDVSTTNYPGKIPSGLDFPSDVGEEGAPNSI